jgi:hypothetical protein
MTVDHSIFRNIKTKRTRSTLSTGSCVIWMSELECLTLPFATGGPSFKSSLWKGSGLNNGLRKWARDLQSIIGVLTMLGSASGGLKWLLIWTCLSTWTRGKPSVAPTCRASGPVARVSRLSTQTMQFRLIRHLAGQVRSHRKRGKQRLLDKWRAASY